MSRNRHPLWHQILDVIVATVRREHRPVFDQPDILGRIRTQLRSQIVQANFVGPVLESLAKRGYSGLTNHDWSLIATARLIAELHPEDKRLQVMVSDLRQQLSSTYYAEIGMAAACLAFALMDELDAGED